MTWEYKYETTGMPGDAEASAQLTAIINERGADGWELLSVVTVPIATGRIAAANGAMAIGLMFWFKRPTGPEEVQSDEVDHRGRLKRAY